jgi:hypothetical protein
VGDEESEAELEYEEIDINIEDMEIGNEVLSFNESTKQLEWKKVLNTFERRNNKLIVLKLSNEIIIKATPEHRFFVSTTNNWIEAVYLEVGMKLLDAELNQIEIKEIDEEIGQFEVHNFEVQDNHNYFAGDVLVHNDYESKQIELKTQILSLTTDGEENSLIKGETRIEYDQNRINQLQAMDRTYDDLINITKNDQNLGGRVRDFALERLINTQAQIQNQIEKEQMELIYNRPQGIMVRAETDRLLSGLYSSSGNTAMNDFEILIKSGYGGEYTVKELQRDKEILQYLLAGEFAIQRSSKNPLLWMAYPLTQSASFMVDMAYNNAGIDAKGSQIAGIAGGGLAALGIVGAGIAAGAKMGGAAGPEGAVSGAAIGLIVGAIGAIGAGVSSLVIVKELQSIKKYKEIIDKGREEKDKVIKIPSEFDYNKPLTDKPNFSEGNDLTDWFTNALETASNSPEMKYMKQKSGTKEQLVLFLELFKTHGSLDLKQYISPGVESNKGLGAHSTYVFDGEELDQDLFGNIFIGYNTQRIGMSLNSALLGAGIFQISDHIDISKNKAEIKLIGGKENYRDDWKDPLGLIVGYELGEKCGDNCTTQDIKQTIISLKEQIKKRNEEFKEQK